MVKKYVEVVCHIRKMNNDQLKNMKKKRMERKRETKKTVVVWS